MCSLFLDSQNEIGPSISSSVVLCFFVLLVYIVVLVSVFYLCPSSVRVVATFPGTVLFPLLCSLLPIFPLIHRFFSLSVQVISHKSFVQSLLGMLFIFFLSSGVVPGKCHVQINASEFFACHFPVSNFLFLNNLSSDLWAVLRVCRPSVKFGKLQVFCILQNSLWTKKSYAYHEKHTDINKKLINLVPNPSVFAFGTRLPAPMFTLLVFLISSALTRLCLFSL